MTEAEVAAVCAVARAHGRRVAAHARSAGALGTTSATLKGRPSP